MKKIILSSILLLAILNGNAQTNCGNKNPTGGPGGLRAAGICGVIHDYSVYPYSNQTPIKYVRVGFDVFQKADGTGNFNASDATLKSYFQKFIDSANYHLSHVSKLTNPDATSPQVVDSRIRLVLNNTWIYKNDALYAKMSQYGGGSNNPVGDDIYNNTIQTRTDLSTIDKSNTLHILLAPKLNNPMGGEARGYGDKRYVYLRGYDYPFNWGNGGPANGFGPSINELVGHFLHEVGHSLSLWHNFQGGPSGSQCDDIADDGCPTEGTSNDYMDYTNPWKNRWAFSEDQIARMHYCLMGGIGDIQDDMIKDYCTYNASQPMSITSGQNIIWPSSKNLVGDLIINGNASLTVKCNVSIPHGGKVIVNNGAKLIIQDHGAFKNTCNDNWNGIEVLSGGYLEINTPTTNVFAFMYDYDITVKAGGSIRINGNLSMAGNHFITVESNGFICIEPVSQIYLWNFNSVINLKCGYKNGVNSSVTGITKNCVTSAESFTTAGSGKINAASFTTDVNLQNQTLSGNQYITGRNITIGNNVSLASGSNIIFNACQDIIGLKVITVPVTSQFEFVKH